LQSKIKESKKQITKLEDKMNELRLVSRAKLVLVQRGMTEDEAHEHIIRTAMNSGLSKRAVAEDILDD
jgi:response regulator NasT